MKKLLDRLINYRLHALIKKEFAQTRHDRKLMFSLAFMPLVQLALIGFALSATVTDVPLAIVDDSRSPESRELIATLTESKSFRLAGYYSRPTNWGMRSARERPTPGWWFLTTLRGTWYVIAKRLFNFC